MDGRDRSRYVGRHVNQKRPRRFRKFLQPALRAVQRVYFLRLTDLLHHEAEDFSIRLLAQRRDGPGREVEQPFIAEARQDDEFLGLLWRRRLMIELGHQVALIPNFIDLALGAGPDSSTQ